MPHLHIDLQKGFVQDSIILRVDGQTILEQSHIQSQWQIGYAGDVETHVVEGLVTINVIIPSRTESKSISLNISGPT